MLIVVDFEDRHARLAKIFDRSVVFDQQVEERVSDILQAVSREGDAALLRFCEQYDGVRPAALKVSEHSLEEAFASLDRELLSVFEEAATNIRRFHEKQLRQSWFTDDGDGVLLGQRMLPLDSVGLYVPGGRAFYPSSLLMNAIPAQVAGVRHLAIASPPNAAAGGLPHPLVLAAARFLGISTVYAVGGAQAVGAFAFGTESIPRVDKIVGPGNVFVAAAKRMVFGPVDIDSVAGPSEIVVLADELASPVYVAADLLAQAEHDERASAVLVTPSRALAEAVCAQITEWWGELDRKEILQSSLTEYSACIVTRTIDQAYDVVNEMAPEHLEIVTNDPWATMTHIRNAGAVFLGPFSSEPIGDYLAGPNHVLPTSGTARYASALGVDDFIKQQSIISYTERRLRRTGPSIIRFAEAEMLTAHARAIRVRLEGADPDPKPDGGV